MRGRLFRAIASKKRLTTKKVLSYGAVTTAGAAVASGAMAYESAQVGHKNESARRAAHGAATMGALATGAILGRKHLARAMSAGSRAGYRSAKKDAQVIFRRIRGRIVPIRRK